MRTPITAALAAALSGTLPAHAANDADLAEIRAQVKRIRADGDVHPGGNPHIQTDARNIARVAVPLAARLAELDPANAAVYQARYKAFFGRWTTAIANWERQAATLRGVPILVHHKAFPYLEDWLGQIGFHALFAVAVTVSVQLVGLYLVFATLIVPPLATRRMTRNRLPVAWVLGVVGYALGLLLATALDLPAGPVIVWVLVALALLWHAAAASKGASVNARG